ncbi:MAG TPA: Holliday junction branch migration protein RuvA [Verrucomicrobiota bacterium]|nr:Holliday junction branch migration protein RuvA [Verrucomicrobiales bacterium]HRI12223.1 Holliday junction branch migration protein RuvA [Verrucomicrobiota bacterium]
MIAFLQGRLLDVLPTTITVEVHGIGYEVLIPLSSFDRLPAAGQEVRLLTHLVVREDAHTLYGFMTASERDLFRLLIHTVSGVGPKLALNVLSGVSVSGFSSAVASGDIKALSGISGVGRKTAERIIVELKDKMGIFGGGPAAGAAGSPGMGSVVSATEARINDATAALVALGFKAPDALQTVRGAFALLGESASVEQLVRASLKRGSP